nr:MAG TPA: hypothetical protein [Caudoviricetes sp.]
MIRKSRGVNASLFLCEEVNIWKSEQDREVLFLYRKFKNRGT